MSQLIYIFAGYGLACFLYFIFRDKINWDRFEPAEPVLSSSEQLVVLRVIDVEDRIEGLVRECAKVVSRLNISERFLILDGGSRDQTTAILERLTYRYPYLISCGELCSAPKVELNYDWTEPPGRLAKRLATILQQEICVKT